MLALVFVSSLIEQVYINGGGENEKFIAYAPEDEERAFRFV